MNSRLTNLESKFDRMSGTTGKGILPTPIHVLPTFRPPPVHEKW
jgi:hypothetical protein